MVNVSYVYPNVSEISQRGGLPQRWELAKELGCNYIEIPADFIKNKTEVEKTGLSLGDFLTEKAINTLYTKSNSISHDTKYILHTEPSLPRNDGYGISHQAPLKWFNQEWTKRMIDMVILISRFFDKPASAIEIHPGDKRNSFEDIITSMEYLLGRYNEEFNAEPLILMENRTGQFISDGTEIYHFWEYLSEHHPHMKNKMGVVLDIQQLYTVTKKNFLEELATVPLEGIKGFHIHYRHKLPDISNEIPWRQVFDIISSIEHDIIINPEIHHKNKVKDTIQFCKMLLGNTR